MISHDVVASVVRDSPIRQVASVVLDLEASVRFYWKYLGIGPWTAYTLDPSVLQDAMYHGKPASFSARHALAWKDGLQFELVQPLAGPSIWRDHLELHGEGLHHLGVYVDDHALAVAQLQESGFCLVQSARGFGATGDGAFAYFETNHPLAAVLEVIEAPSQRRPPAFIYPPDND